MKIHWYIASCLFILSLWAPATREIALPTSYYVNLQGSDENPGTKARPFQSLEHLKTLNLKPGDRIFLRGGQVFSGPLELQVNGKADRPIIVSSYGRESALIDGGPGEAIILKGSHFRLERLNAKGAGRKTGSRTPGVRLVEARNAQLSDLRIEGFQKAGLDIWNCQQVEVRRVLAIQNGFSGILVSGTDRNSSKNILIQDCRAENNPGDPTILDNHSGNGILVGMSDSVIIDHCTATENGWDMPRQGNGPVGIWAYESSHVLIQYCIAYRNKTSKGAKDGGGFDFDGGVTNSIIQYCLSYENEGAGYGLFQYWGASNWSDNIVRYCVSINDATTTEGAGAFFIWNGSEDPNQLQNAIIHNNLVYSSKATVVQFEPNSQNRNFLFFNNIFIGVNKVVDGPSSGERFNGNVWWTAGGDIRFRGFSDLAEWAEQTGQEMEENRLLGRQLDPKLRGPLPTSLTDPHQLHALPGFSLQKESPLIDSGKPVPPFFDLPQAIKDFSGRRIPQGKAPEPGVREW